MTQADTSGSAAKTVLLCEDEYIVAMDLQLILEDFGYKVVGPFAKVSAGLDAVQDFSPDVAFLDVNLRDGQVFPPDLAVGIAVVGPDGTPRARLAADLERLEFVRILRYRPDTTIDRPGGLIRNGPLPDAAPLDGEAGEAVDGEESGAAGDAGGPSPEASDGGAQSPVAAATR